MNRRDFILKSTVAGSALLLNPESLKAVTGKLTKPQSVIVIGAGFAGLAAGLKLQRMGIKVTILESRNRIGGRVFSYHPSKSPGQVIEFGAEWVGESHVRLLELCQEFGLTVENNQFDTGLTIEGKYSKAGKWSLSPEMEKFWSEKSAYWEQLSEVEKQKLDKTDWWRFLSLKGFSERDLYIRDLLDSTDFGETIRHTSAYVAFAEYAESSEKNEMDFKIKGGNGLLPQAMATAIGMENIKINHTVSVIDQTSTQVKIKCSNGSEFTADRMICAIPTYSLMKINWEPHLPSHYIDALHELQYARIGKFPIVFSERFWKREDFDMVTDTPAHYFYHGTKNQPGKTGVLMCYATGDRADSLASVDLNQRTEIILDALKPAFGNVKKYVKEQLMYYWGKDKYSAGSYAFYGKSQWFEVMPELKKPHLNCHFAGEHIADWQGFMEGAINSGEDAVDELLLS